MGYREEFAASDEQDGAYHCFLTLADPAGFIMRAGGPTAAYVAPAAGEHGSPASAVMAAVVGLVASANSPIPAHLPAPQPNPSPDHKQVYVTPAEWQSLIAGRWDNSQSAKNKKFTFLQEHHMTEFHVADDLFTYRADNLGKVVAVYDAQTQKSYNIEGTRKGLLRIPLTLTGEPTFAGTPHLFPITGNQQNVVEIKMMGNRDADFKAANEAANLDEVVKAQGRRPSRAPKGYTWHHRADFAPTSPPTHPTAPALWNR